MKVHFQYSTYLALRQLLPDAPATELDEIACNLWSGIDYTTDLSAFVFVINPNPMPARIFPKNNLLTT